MYTLLSKHEIRNRFESISKYLTETHILEAAQKILEEITEKDSLSISFSGGKDSTAVLFLVGVLLKADLLQARQINILHSDTTIEFPLLSNTAFKILNFVESEWKIKVDVVSAPVEERFFATLFGFGRPVPNHAVRWCTDNLKLKPQARLRKQYKDTYVLTGEHYGESANRDNKLSACGTSDCGVADVSKTVEKEKLIRPILNWRDCNVWDFLFYVDSIGILYPGVYNELSHVYEISNDDYMKGSLRTGCIGCPVISTHKHYNTESKGIPTRLSLKLRLILEEMRSDDLRVRNPKIPGGLKPNGHRALGAIALPVRRYYWDIVKDLNTEFTDIGITLISNQEIEFVDECLDKGQYPKTYKPDVIQILEKEWLKRKPEWFDFSPNCVNKRSQSTMQTLTTTPKPFLKWAGGKNALLPQLTPLLPQTIARYCEPFVGGGAMLWHVLTHHKPQNVMICDINPDLILTYRVVRDWCDHLIPKLTKLEREYHALTTEAEKREYFTMVRSLFNLRAKSVQHNLYGVVSTLDERFIDRAAQVIFLNKTCFNGLWRVRKTDGKFFNSPFGKYDTPKICDAENLQACAIALRGVDIVCGDFRQCTDFIDGETFVYLDPPYLPVSKTSNFTGYSEGGWGEEDAIALRNWMLELNRPDPLMQFPAIVLSSGVTDIWDELTREDDFEVVEVTARRNINSMGDRRGDVTELVFRNFCS